MIELQFNLTTNTSLYDFYSKFGQNWIQIIKQSIISVVIDVTAKFNLFDFWEKREEFKTEIINEISKKLKYDTFDSIIIRSFKLINIEFSDNLHNAIEAKLIEKQNTRTAKIEGEINYINKKTESLVRLSKEEISSINKIQYSQYENAKIKILTDCFNTISKADTDSYLKLNSDLGLSSDNNLIPFIYNFERRKFKGKQLINFSDMVITQK